MARIESGVRIAAASILGAASISKQFTALSILLLAKRSQLSLDDDVSKYVPDWADRDSHVTIRHLLTRYSRSHAAAQAARSLPTSTAAKSTADRKFPSIPFASTICADLPRGRARLIPSLRTGYFPVQKARRAGGTSPPLNGGLLRGG